MAYSLAKDGSKEEQLAYDLDSVDVQIIRILQRDERASNLIVMAFASGWITLAQLLWNWVVVCIGNFVGSILTALAILASKQYTLSGGALGANALGIANAKCDLGFFQVIALGTMCNAVVCLAV